MNVNNLKKIGLHGAKLVSTTPHLQIHTATQRALGYGRPPSLEESTQFTDATVNNPPEQREFVEQDGSALHAVRSILALTALDHAVHSATADQRLSLVGRAERLAPVRTATIKAIAEAGASVVAVGRDVQAREAAFYAPAKLPAGDAVAAHEDTELRTHWRTAPTPQRTVLLQQMQAGQNDRMLGALTRSPIPLAKHETGIVEGAWRDSVDKRMPTESAALKASLANHQWADSVVKASARYAARSVGLSHSEIAAAAAGTGGEHLFSNADNIPINTTGHADAHEAA